MIRDWNEYFSRDREVATALSQFCDFIDRADVERVIALLRSGSYMTLKASTTLVASDHASFDSLYNAARDEIASYA